MAFYAGRIILEPAMANPTHRRPDRPQRPRRPALRDVRPLPRPAAPGRRSRRRTAPTCARSSPSARAGSSSRRSRSSCPTSGATRHPVLSDRRNIVVIADEAHRSQYDFIDGFARHLRDALPERLVHRLHRHADRADRRQHPRGLRRLHQRLRHPARGRRRRDGPDLLREPAREARARRGRAPEDRPGLRGGHRGRGGRAQGAAEEPLGAARGARRRRAADPPGRRATSSTHFEDRLAAMDGKAMVVTMSRRIARRPLPRDRRAPARVGRRRRRRRRAQGRDDRARPRTRSTGRTHIRNKPRREALAARFREPGGPVPDRHRARHVADRLRRALACTRCTSTSRCAGTA